MLIEQCYRCHSAEGERIRGGLLLDSRSGALQGGESGRPSIVPGDPEGSLLVEAIRYGNVDLLMPPKTKLSDREIADLVRWIEMGAPWPEAATGTQLAGSHAVFDIEERKRAHWSWQPVAQVAPPEVEQIGWSRQPVDRFILESIEKAGLKPSAEAERRTLARRLHFDLTGLPPTSGEMEVFLADSSEGAYERLVDRLLESPRFGERWARHWLDLVRYAETLGHEFDYALPGAWQYRDYVIRAFNADLPYDQFVREHIAGDLLDAPRRHPTEGFNESVIGTGFYWLGQQTHSPVDVRLNQAEVIENQIDVLSKTFLGLTVACARCHDHKFDPIPTKDFYALYGILASSRYAQRPIHPPEQTARAVGQLRDLKSGIRSVVGDEWAKQASDMQKYLLATREVLRETASQDGSEPRGGDAVRSGLDPDRLHEWVRAFSEESVAAPSNPWHLWKRAVSAGDDELTSLWLELKTSSDSESLRARESSSGVTVLADFSTGERDGWLEDGEAFATGFHGAGDLLIETAGTIPVRVLPEAGLNSRLLSRRLQGAIRSRTFPISERYLHIRAAGRDARLNVVIDNFVMIQDPIYGALRRVLDRDEPGWITIDLERWKGHRAYVEFKDLTAGDLAAGGRPRGYPSNGWVAVREVLASGQNTPPAPAPRTLASLEPSSSMEALAEQYQRAVQNAVRAFQRGARPEDGELDYAVLGWLVEKGLFTSTSERVLALLANYRQVEDSIPEATLVPAMADGPGFNEVVFVRGNPRMAGEVAPRRFLEAIDGEAAPEFGNGSGRLELAGRLIDPANPFLARVMVNRVWHHLFGRGIVPTPDDFGVLGQEPSHPELLDWLADWYRDAGNWSTKQLIRLLVTSSTYRMESRPSDPVAEVSDPDNRLWHRMPIRRLEGEAIRDSMLALSGRLDLHLFGPPVPIHLTEFMDGRGRPGQSGPLDGAGRRSIYLEVRRNFVSPMLRAFDMPVPMTTIGRRTSSNVPAQSLFLMNDPFVYGEARRWAERVMAEGAPPEKRVQSFYQSAFGRPASGPEMSEALDFVRRQGVAYGFDEEGGLPVEAWADLCHVLFNVKEFSYLN